MAIRKRVKNIGDIKNIPLVIPTVDISDGREYIFTNNPINNDNKYIDLAYLLYEEAKKTLLRCECEEVLQTSVYAETFKLQFVCPCLGKCVT